MNKKDIQRIVGKKKNKKLKKYILTAGGKIIQSNKLEYDEFMECFGLAESTCFEPVVIIKESDDIRDLISDKDKSE